MSLSPVVLISIDGLRADVISAEATPNMSKLMARGVWSLSCQSVMPSVTLPCHMSMFHSVDPGRHGIVTNTWTPQVRPIEGLFEVAHRAMVRTGAFYNWEQLRDLWRPGSLTIGMYDADCRTLAGDRIVATEAAMSVEIDELELIFVYLGVTDEVRAQVRLAF